MNCEEIGEQIAEITTQFGTLDDDASMQRSTINTNYEMALMGDTYGGVYPSSPIQSDGLAARITYLNGLTPKPGALIGSYKRVQILLTQLGGTEDARQQNVDLLGEMKQQGVDAGCGF